jgi:hypothetical protein
LTALLFGVSSIRAAAKRNTRPQARPPQVNPATQVPSRMVDVGADVDVGVAVAVDVGAA